jgi:hypothetical protein
MNAIGSVFRSARALCAGSVLLLALTSTGNTADAPASGPYIRAGVVESSLKLDGIGAVLRPAAYLQPAEHFGDERKTGWSIAAGWRLQRHVAVEAGYADFGDRTLNPSRDTVIASSNTNTSSTSTAIHGGTALKTKAVYAAIVGSWPLGNWEPYVKLGMLHVDTSAKSKTITTFSSFFSGRPPSFIQGTISVDDSTTEALTAIGVTYTIAGHYDVNLEAARMPNVGGSRTTGEGDLTSLSLGIGYRF